MFLKFCLKMLAVFEKAIGNPPEELKLPSMGLETMKSRQDIVEIVRSLWPDSTVYSLANGNFMASSHENESPSQPRYYITILLLLSTQKKKNEHSTFAKVVSLVNYDRLV